MNRPSKMRGNVEWPPYCAPQAAWRGRLFAALMSSAPSSEEPAVQAWHRAAAAVISARAPMRAAQVASLLGAAFNEQACKSALGEAVEQRVL